MTNAPHEAPHRSWQIAAYRFTRWDKQQKSYGGRWGVSRYGRGVDFYRTPFGAIYALRRWQNISLDPIDE